MPTSTFIDLLRHGEPVGGRRYRGQIDDPLSDKGWTQMRAAVGDHCPWDLIVSSTLSRCQAFAEELAARHNLPLELESRLCEIGFGSWEGRTGAELREADEDVLLRFWSDPLNNRPEGAETLAAFEERVVGAWQDIIERHRGRHVLVVGHAGQMRMVLRHVLDMPLDALYRLQIRNAGLARVEVVEQDGITFNKLYCLNGSLDGN